MVVEKLQGQFPNAVLDVAEFRGQTTITVAADALVQMCTYLRDEPELNYDLLLCVTAVDYSSATQLNAATRFATVYELYSVPHKQRLRLKVPLEGDAPRVSSVTSVWQAAYAHERETYDLMGIVFDGHPYLRRLMLPDDWVGHPLRKDYAIGGETVAFTVNTDEPDLQTVGQQILEAPSFPPAIPPGARNDTMLLNVGPQHPATHGVLRLVVELSDSDIVLNIWPDLGHLHSGMEKSVEDKKYQQVIPYTDRTDYTASMNNNLGYVLTVEKLLGIEPPLRAQYLRVIWAELSRLGSYAIWLGTHNLDLSNVSSALLMYTFRDREEIFNLIELVCGARMTPSFFRVGGLREDVPPAFVPETRAFIDRLDKRLDDYERLLDNPMWRARTEGIAYLSKEDALAYGVTGPVLRGSGVPRDLRKDEPYSCYDHFDFNVITRSEGDCYARYLVRMAEMRESIKIVRQALDDLPDGPVQYADYKISLPPREQLDTSMEALIHHFKLVTDGFNAPPGEIYVGTENPKGELGFFLVSDGGPNPYRLKIRGPSFSNIWAIKPMVTGAEYSDVISAIGSIDIVLGEIDR